MQRILKLGPTILVAVISLPFPAGARAIQPERPMSGGGASTHKNAGGLFRQANSRQSLGL